MPAPWDESDCALTATIAAALVGASAPWLGLREIRYAGEGWDSWVYGAVTPDGIAWILRFPKRAEVAAGLKKEIALLPELAPTLPLAVPRFELVGEPSAAYPHRFVGYRRLPGQPAIETPGALLRLAPWSLLARFVAALHAFPTERAAQLGIERQPGESREARAAEATRQLAACGGLIGASARQEALRLLGTPVEDATERVLVHADFAPEHLLMDGDVIGGVIDWGDVALDDPATDLAGIHYAGGDEALSAALAQYGADRNVSAAARASMASRAKFISVCRAAADLEYGLTSGRPPYTTAALAALARLARS